MDKEKQKEKCRYAEKLDEKHKKRYLEKLEAVNGFDPYECRDKDFESDFNLLPPLAHADIVYYLVWGISAFSRQELKNYKSLEAHQQFTFGWVHDLKIYKPANCDNTLIKAKVLHSQRLNEKPLQPWVIIDKNGEVVSAHCDCMAGLAESCTHVGALLFKIDAVVRLREQQTVTGVPAYWMVPANLQKIEPTVGYKIDFRSATAQKKQLDFAIDNNQPMQNTVRTGCTTRASAPKPTEEETRAFFEGLHLTGHKAAILSILPEYCQDYIDPVKPVVLPKSLKTLRNRNLDNASKDEIMAHCRTLFDAANVSEEEAEKISRETKDQHKVAAWYSLRAGRVTASKMKDVCTFKMEKPALTTVKDVCYPGGKSQQQSQIPSIRWGLQHEEKAKQRYFNEAKEEHFKMTMESQGFVINPECPFMGASPDAIVTCECCGKGCVEVKCPAKHKNAKIVDAVCDKDFCLELINEQFALKKDHRYYYQVQCEMLSTKADFCDFVVWTTEDMAVVRVEPDEDFMAHLKVKAEAFFQNVVLPEMVAKAFTCTPTDVALLPLGQQKRPLSVSPVKATSRQTLGRKKKQPKKQWCLCSRSEEYDNMIACDNPQCAVGWYHFKCVGITDVKIAEKEWFCQTCKPSSCATRVCV